MTEQQRNHLIRMVRHAESQTRLTTASLRRGEKVRRNMDNLRRTNESQTRRGEELTPQETAKVLRKWKRKYPDFFEPKKGEVINK